ncbi:MAG TPA: hypothetical protein VGD90_05010 [Sphingobacteriaceae bacterium]
MHFLRLIGIWAIVLIAVEAAAQKRSVKGIIYEQGTPSRVGEVTVINKNNHLRAKTSYMGEFTIPAAAGDTLYFSKEGYADYRLPLRSTKEVVIQLIRFKQLAEVTITAPTKKEELEEVLQGYRKKGSYYHGKPPVLTYIFKPLTALYELLGRTPRQAKRFYNYYETELEQTEIDRRFNRSLVKGITQLPEVDLTNFMDQYRPEYQKLISWNEYDLMNYIAVSVKDFNDKGRPAADTLPDLREIAIPEIKD